METNVSEQFQRNGWVILKGFFTPQEIQLIRQGTEKSLKENLKKDLLCNPYLRDLTVLNEKIISLVAKLLNAKPVYIGDSSISFNELTMSLHKDNPDRFDANAPDWRSAYNVLRMGIYLQDYTEDSGGLILRDKSHLYPTRWKGKIINVQTKPGDLVVWNLRTTHSGNAKRLKASPGLDLNPYLCKVLPNFLFKPAPDNRMALFLSYGAEGPHLERYITYLKNRKYAIERWRNMEITPELVAQGHRVGLKVLNLVDDAKEIDLASVSEGHIELPY